MIKTIVIGAGVMGASAAYRLAQAGAAVTVLEARRIGGGTSGISFAWTNAHKKPPKPYHDLNVAGMKAHRALADEFGATPWWHGGGSLEWEAEPDRTAQRENVEQLQAWGYAAEWITSRQAQELEPDIDPAATGGVNTRNPTVGASGKCRPASLVASLVQRPAQFTTVSASYCAPSVVRTPVTRSPAMTRSATRTPQTIFAPWRRHAADSMACA